MKAWWLAAIAAATIEGAAVACSCFLGATTDAGKRAIAAEIAATSVAVVEAVQIQPMNLTARRAPLYRVTRVHIGKAPRTFRDDTTFRNFGDGLVDVDMDSCDASPDADRPRIAILYRARGKARKAADGQAIFHLGGMCTYLFLTQDDGLRLIKEEARRLKRPVPARRKRRGALAFWSRAPS